MKRVANLFDSIADRDNLRLAVARALRGKRDRAEARAFQACLERNLDALQTDLLTDRLAIGEFRQFVIHDPKERIITAPCFRERVLHHAIMNVCEPYFDRWLIDDTFACRRERGRVAAVLRAQQFSRRYGWYLKLDIRRYFDSIPHQPLNARLTRLFKDARLLSLFARVIAGFRGKLGRGLPIGSLTSQHFANFYLGWFDRWVKERWRVPGYVRYMDDMLLWSDSRDQLRELKESAHEDFLGELGLELKPNAFVNRSHLGVDFLGCRVYAWGATLNRRSRVRYQRKITSLERQHERGEISGLELQQRATALVAFTQAAGVASWRFRRRTL
ncbi:MAG: reverse transcriptase/maturase family protein [Pirellulales bacterium]